MAKKFTDEDDDILSELGVEVESGTTSAHSAREERIIAGFEEIQRFVDEHGRVPQHGESRDIFERLYAVRLDRIRALPECRTVVESLDRQGLLADTVPLMSEVDALDDDALLAELGVDPDSSSDITDLKHVRSAADKRAAEEIANRERCEDFETFRPLFEKVQRELDNGARGTRRFERKSEIEQGRFYILSGQKAYVASMGELYVNESGNRDARLRVIYDNGTESNLLMRSLQKALQQDPTGRRITEDSLGPLFGGDRVKDDAGTPSGTIYVLRSNLDHPFVKANREIMHKIGVTGNDVDRRVGDTMVDPTYLMGEVEVVAVYQLFDLNRTKLETLIHRLFASARVDIEIPDRFGNVVRPKEWYLVPLFVIDEAIERFKDGSIVRFVYDGSRVQLVEWQS